MTPNNSLEQFIGKYYLPHVVEGLRTIDAQVLEDISERVAHRIREGRRLFGFGNGGSEAISEAFIYALEQRISPEFQFDTYSNPKLSEAVDSPNQELFNHRIKRSGRKGDLAILVSASGNSDNVNTVSAICRENGVETVAISGNGRIANDPETKTDYSIVIPIEDQQILEDVTLGVIYLIAELTQYKTEAKEYDVATVRSRYIDQLVTGFGQLSARAIGSLAADIIQAYKIGKLVRIDAPDSGQLSINAKHMQHNLKWDAFQDVKNRLPNRVYSGLPTYHLSGVANDGGECFNYTVEVDDNNAPGDVELLFTREIGSRSIQALLKVAEKKRMSIHQFSFNVESEYVASNLTQSVLHLTSRVINAHLLCEQAYSETFEDQLRQDLALLRQKDKIRQRLERVYKTNG